MTKAPVIAATIKMYSTTAWPHLDRTRPICIDFVQVVWGATNMVLPYQEGDLSLL
jgi:hypothetical protein